MSKCTIGKSAACAFCASVECKSAGACYENASPLDDDDFDPSVLHPDEYFSPDQPVDICTLMQILSGHYRS